MTHTTWFCMRLYISRPKMSAYQSAFGYCQDFLAIFRPENSRFWAMFWAICATGSTFGHGLQVHYQNNVLYITNNLRGMTHFLCDS